MRYPSSVSVPKCYLDLFLSKFNVDLRYADESRIPSIQEGPIENL